MRRLMISLCALTLSVLAAAGTPQLAEARPICPRGETFTNCLNGCPSDISAACLSAIGYGFATGCNVALEQSGCEHDFLCDAYNPNNPYKITCTYY